MSETYQAVERERDKLRQELAAANAKLGMTEHANREGAEWAQWAAKRITALERALPDSTELRILAEWLKFRAISPDADAANQFWAWADAIDAARREGKP